VHVGGEVGHVSPREGFLALAARGLDDLPPDRPAMAMRVEAAGVLLGVHDVGSDAAVEVGQPVAAEDFLKGRGEAAKLLEHQGAVDEMGDGPPGVGVARPEDGGDREQSDEPHCVTNVQVPTDRLKAPWPT
jgi:hypothetical protein